MTNPLTNVSIYISLLKIYLLNRNYIDNNFFNITIYIFHRLMQMNSNEFITFKYLIDHYPK